MNRPDCHYCDGTGVLDEQIDVDNFRYVECYYCEGTGEARHTANTNTRWIGPTYWIGGHARIGDPLVLTAQMRAAYLRKRNAWDGNYAAQLYGEIRQLAVKPVVLPKYRRRVEAQAERDARTALANHEFVMGHMNRLFGVAA